MIELTWCSVLQGLNVGSKGGERCGTMKANFEPSFDAIDVLLSILRQSELCYTDFSFHPSR